MTERFETAVQRRRVTVSGIVQGVGFRPFVYGAATDLGLKGWVRNSGAAVVIDVEGTEQLLDRFLRILESDAPPLAVVHEITQTKLRAESQRSFRIVESTEAVGRIDVSPDTATCIECLDEVANPAERRYQYPFTNCTNCGPRFTIVEDVPYDRRHTTMSTFEMCRECHAEYSDPSDRRFHAQPVCCPMCGPMLSMTTAAGATVGHDVVEAAAAILLDDMIVAVKGLGGYHLAALARSNSAVERLRALKHREDKPFAVMVGDIESGRALCEISEVEREMLTDIARPIVVMRRRDNASLALSVAPFTNEVGVMLPYTPLHTLLLEAVNGPIVLTSGNLSDEPIAFRDDDAQNRLSRVADACLTHNRAIRTRTDDSVVREMAGQPMMIRRSRGYVPRAIRLPVAARRPILACGAELKSTVTLATGDQAIMSHHIGDLKNLETYTSFVDAVEHFERLFHIAPEVVAHDLHPNYLSTKFAHEIEGVDLVPVQHHHAHIAACMVDSGYSDRVIGVAFDGLGYGTDGSIWGGEFLVADLVDFERVGWLEPLPLPGGDAVMREPWRMTAVYLDRLGESDPSDIDVRRRQPKWADVVSLSRSELAGPPSSSVGRLFDAVAALLGVRDTVNYEGQAAVELEQLVDPDEHAAYPAALDGEARFTVRGSDLVAAALSDLRSGVEVGRISARFHAGLADTVVRAVVRIRDGGGPSTVAVSGGVFLNKVLCEAVMEKLRLHGFRVLRHRNVPPNDGCISLGQAAVAAARDAR